MQGHLHAVAILFVPLVAAVLCWRFQDPERGQQRAMRALMWGLVCVAGCFLTSSHGCGHGLPFVQWLVPGVCVGATVGVIGPQRVRRIAAVLMGLAGFALSQHYIHLVHTPGYTGNPAWLQKYEADIHEAHLNRIRRALRAELRDESAVCPSGWLDEAPVSDFLGVELPVLPQGWSTGTSPAWHTYFTRLYHSDTREDLRVWCPGGVFDDAIDGLEFRPSP